MTEMLDLIKLVTNMIGFCWLLTNVSESIV